MVNMVMGLRAHAVTDGRSFAQWAFGWAPRFGLYAWDHTDPEQVHHGPVVLRLSCCMTHFYGATYYWPLVMHPISGLGSLVIYFHKRDLCMVYLQHTVWSVFGCFK